VTFTVSNAKQINKNTLIGRCDLTMPSGLIVRGAMLLEKNGKRWVNFPSKEWTDGEGKKNYSPLLEFTSREVADKFQAAVLPLVERALLP
jgi:DNA-binding cell septation regulator SpoVG